MIRETIRQELDRHWEMLLATWKELHRNAELGYQEFTTAAILKERLRAFGIEHADIYATGIIATQRGSGGGKTIALRSDMDALPIHEETGVDFASKNEGVMHACGHDAHMTMVLGAAIVLSRLKGQLPGNIRYIFQPAEELSGGAKGMVENGALRNPDVDRILGIHVSPDLLSAGEFGVCRRETNASSNDVRIRIFGRGGHISTPQASNNPIYAGVQLIQEMQLLRTQMFSPFDDVVLDVAAVRAGGEASNIIPEEFSLVASVRAYDMEMVRRVEQRLQQILEGLTQARGISYEMKFNYGFEPVLNDEQIAEEYRESAGKAIGADRVVVPPPEMGAEDFSEYLKYVPGAYGFIGVAQEVFHMTHSPKYLTDADTIKNGILILCQAAVDYLQE